MAEITPSVFVHIPKSAGKSMSLALSPFAHAIENIGHMVPTNQHKDKFVFGFVRHPEARIRSAFYHLIDLPEGTNMTPYQWKRLRLLKEYGPDFGRFVMERGFEKYDFVHFRPQAIFDPPSFDFMGRIESLQKDWSALCQRINLPLIPLPRINESSYPARQPDTTEAMRKIIQEYYEVDYKTLKYPLTTR